MYYSSNNTTLSDHPIDWMGLSSRSEIGNNLSVVDFVLCLCFPGGFASACIHFAFTWGQAEPNTSQIIKT